jgi:hypothetical protein
MSMHRAGCDGMTFKDGHCKLHKNTSDFRVTQCAKSSAYRYVIK